MKSTISIGVLALLLTPGLVCAQPLIEGAEQGAEVLLKQGKTTTDAITEVYRLLLGGGVTPRGQGVPAVQLDASEHEVISNLKTTTLTADLKRTIAQAQLAQPKVTATPSLPVAMTKMQRIMEKHHEISLPLVAQEGDLELLQFMKQNGTWIKDTEEEQAALLEAALPHPKIVNYLMGVENKSWQNFIATNNILFATKAVERDFHLTTYLLATTMTTEELDRMLYISAVKYNNFGIAQGLARMGARWEKVFEQDMWFHINMKEGYPNDGALTYVLASNVNPNMPLPQSAYGYTASHALANAGIPEKVGQLDILKKYGADMNIPDADGDRPLHLAVWYPQYEERLLSLGADPTLTNNLGLTPLEVAKEKLAAAKTEGQIEALQKTVELLEKAVK